MLNIIIYDTLIKSGAKEVLYVNPEKQLSVIIILNTRCKHILAKKAKSLDVIFIKSTISLMLSTSKTTK